MSDVCKAVVVLIVLAVAIIILLHIGYQFTSGCKVKKVFFKPYWSGDTYNVEGSNDGNTWNNIGSIIGNVSGSTAVVNAMIDYTYYRFNQSTRISSNNLQEFLTAQFYGRQDV